MDDAMPTRIRRWSGNVHDLQNVYDDRELDEDSPDEAAPPPIQRSSSTSLKATSSRTTSRSSVPPLPSKSPLRSQLEARKLGRRPPRNFSHPFNDQLVSGLTRTIPYRHPSNPISHRSNPRLPLSLKRWSSLETIDSVTTTPSVLDDSSRDEPEYSSPEGSTPRAQRLFLFGDTENDKDDEEAESVRYSAPSEPSLTQSIQSSELSESDSQHSSTPSRPGGSRKHSVSSMLRRLRSNKDQEPLLLPEHLEIEKRVSLDQQSRRTTSSSSNMTISSGRPSEAGHYSSPSASASPHLQTSREWKSSSYDVSGLSEVELRKCEKKGINPALYAEMKAARRGKFVSPIGGNTFL